MQKLNHLKHNIADVAEPTQQLYNKFVIEESLKYDLLAMVYLSVFKQTFVFSSEWKSAIRDKKCPCKTRSNARAKHLVDRLRDSWQHLLRDRATRSLTYNDEQFHALEKIKVCLTRWRRIQDLNTISFA